MISLFHYLFVIATLAFSFVSTISKSDQQFGYPLIESLQVRLEIPALEVDAPLTRFFLGGDSWDIDPWEPRPGHFVYTAWVGEPGNMVVGGHVEYPDGTEGVFADLHTLKISNSIRLRLGTRTWIYRVVDIKTVAHDDLSVLYPGDRPRLTLITCDEPSFDAATGLYDKRLVIAAELEQ